MSSSMQSLILSQLYLLLCLLLTCKASSVVKLTESNFDEYTSKYELVFINFYADWCRFSQILAPVFEEAANKVAEEFPPDQGRVLFVKVDCEVESSLGTRFHITKYPTLKLMMHGKQLKKEFRGQRSVESISQHVRDLLKDPIKPVITFDEFNKIEEEKGAIVGYFSTAPMASPEYVVFRKVAIDLRDDCNFYWVTGDPATAHLNQGQDFSVTFKSQHSHVGEKDLVYPGVMHSYDELSTWAKDKCIPMVREITFENAEELTEEGLPFLILFYNPDDKSSIDLYKSVVTNELYTESGNMNFLIADGVKFAHPLHHLGKTQKDLPLIAIDSFRHMYLFPDFKEANIPGKLKTFIQDLYSGKLHREFHFGPDSGVHVIGSDPNQVGQTSPPESTFVKLGPSRNRYTLLKDEL